MGRRLFTLLLCLCAVPTAAAAAAPSKPSTWASREIAAVTAAGLMGGGAPSAFRPGDPLTAQALEDLSFELARRLAPPSIPGAPAVPMPATTETTTTAVAAAPAAPKQVASPGRAVTLAQLDARLVNVLGLGRAALVFRRNARAAGLRVPARFGTEVVARLLGLRLNHPAADDSLELLPNDPATRAEAAYSVARLLRFEGWETDAIDGLADGFVLPELTDWQKRILTTAVARIGMPYVWGGESDGRQTASGVSAPGGYDCSGFVRRVYKLEAYPGGEPLASTLRGRTTYQMSGEVPRSMRIAFASLEPADVIFFGDRGARSRPSGIGHMGIYLGSGWFIHSSSDGVAVTRLDGWYARTFAWGRRPLAEAGLAP